MLSNLPKVTQPKRTNVYSYSETGKARVARGRSIVEGAAQEKQSTPVPTRYPGPVSILDSSCRGRPGSLLGEMHWEDSPT